MAIPLSEHFDLSEFTTSENAARMGREIVVVPGDGIFESLQALCVNVLEPIRSHFGRVVVTSGYRPEWLNAVTQGSASTSQHTKGEAADFHCPEFSVEEVTRWVAEQSGLPFDQVIFEFNAWTHCSYTKLHEPRHSIITAKHTDSGTVYLPGIVPFN